MEGIKISGGFVLNDMDKYNGKKTQFLPLISLGYDFTHEKFDRLINQGEIGAIYYSGNKGGHFYPFITIGYKIEF